MMKFKFYLIVALFLNLFTHISFSQQSGWFWQNPLPQGNSLYDVQVLDDNTYICIGGNSSVLKTTNSGLNWNVNHYIGNSSRNITFSFFINSYTGWIGQGATWNIYDNGVHIYKTTDGCTTWNLQFIDSSYKNFYCMYFASPLVGWVCGNSIVKTADGGLSWIYQVRDTLDIAAAYFYNESTGWITGDDNILKTTNGGMNWMYQVNPGWWQAPYNSISFINQNTGWIGGRGLGRLVYTTNGGNNWTQIFPIPAMLQIYFKDFNTGWTLGFNGISKTTNSGFNWSIINDTSFYSISFKFYPNFFSIGFDGKISKSLNEGYNWISLSHGFYNSIYSIQFTDSLNGFAIADENVFSSSNGGLNWNQSHIDSLAFPNLYFINNQTGWAVGNSSYSGKLWVYKTTNSSNNWNRIYQGGTGNNNIIKLITDSIGFIVGASVLKTVDGGNNWFSVFWGPHSSFGSFSIPDAKNIYIAADNGIVYKSDNLGKTWEILSLNIHEWLKLAYFISDSVGWVTGKRIYKTEDGGFTWQCQLSDSTSYYFSSIQFINYNTGWAASGDKVLKTTNSGVNWIPEYTGSPYIRSLCFINYKTGWAAGSNGSILKTTTGGDTIVTPPPPPVILSEFALYPNYPNPFNRGTNIKFEFAKQSHVKLVIYDILGRKVATLVDEVRNAGIYTEQWDGKNFASGVYFYQLRVGNYVQTRKMVLLK